MGIFDGIVLCSDIDGTLIWEGKLSEENREAIRYFENEGGHFVISTGRFASFVHEELQFDPHSPVICVNGTLVYDDQNQKILKMIPMTESEIDRSRSFYVRHQDRLYVAHLHCAKGTWAAENTAEFDRALEEIQKETPLLKVVYVFKTPEEAIRAQEEFLEEQKDGICMERSWPVGVEVHGSGSGKDVCMKYIQEYYGAHTTAAVGDYENDLSMLRAADLSYATGNALDEVKKTAGTVTPPCWEHAVAWVIEDLKKKVLSQV